MGVTLYKTRIATINAYKYFNIDVPNEINTPEQSDPFKNDN